MGLSYKETTFVMQKLNNEIEQAAVYIDEQLQELHENLTTKLNRAVSSQRRLEQNFTEIPEKSTEYNKNQRFYKLYEEFYLSLMQNKAEFEIAVAGLTPDFQILSPASLPSSPVYPKKILIYGVGVSAGLAFCFIFVALAYLLDNKVNGIAELEKIMPYPYIGSIPFSTLNDNKRLISDSHSKSGVSESLRNIRTNIQFILPGNKKVISLSSVIGGEGKTYVSLNLSVIFASSGKKVLLMDLDMRKPKIHTEFDLDNNTGMSTLLIGKSTLEESITKSKFKDLDIIPSGPIPPNPSELLLNPELTSIIHNLEKQYDYIIIDTPPVGLVTDGQIIMSKVDLSLLVVRAGYVNKKDILHFNRQSKLSKYNIATIFNAVRNSSKSGYYYGYYSDKS